MISWILIIVELSIFQILGFSFSFPEVYNFYSAILILVAALGLLYRAYRDQRDKKSRE